MKILLFLLLLSSTIHAQDKSTIIDLDDVSTNGLDKSVAKVFHKTRKLILQARRDDNTESENLGNQKWCLLLHNYHFLKQAQTCYFVVGLKDKNNAKWPYLYAKVSSDLGNFEGAENGLNETIRRNENYLPAHYYKINHAIEENNLASAFEFLKDVPVSLLLTSSMLNLQGDLYFATDNYHVAIGFYQQTLLLVPEAKSLNYKIAKAYQALNLMSEAEDFIKLSDTTKIRLIDPYYQEVKNTIVGEIPFLIQAKTALLNQDNQQAIKLYKKALEFNPKSESALVNLAVAYFNNQQIDLSKEFFNKALALYPNQLRALYNLAVIQNIQGNKSEALKNFEKLRTLTADDVLVNYSLAQIYYELSEYQKVLDIAVLNSMKTHLETQYLKAKVLIQQHKFAQAIQWLTEINKNRPNQFNVLLSLSKLYSQVPDKSLRNPQLSLDLVRQAVKIKANVQSYWQLIMSYDENKMCQDLKIQMKALSQLLNKQAKDVYLKLVKQRGQDLNCTFIND